MKIHFLFFESVMFELGQCVEKRYDECSFFIPLNEQVLPSGEKNGRFQIPNITEFKREKHPRYKQNRE